MKDTIEDIKTQLQAILNDLDIEIFSRDISQYKYVSQSPVVVITHQGTEFLPPPHPSINSQKAVINMRFYYFTRSMDEKSNKILLDFAEAVAKLDDVTVFNLYPHSHKKDVSIYTLVANKKGLLG